MIHVVARLFNAFAFIYMLCNNYTNLNTTKSIIAVTAFDSLYKSLSVVLSFADI